jgi:hypothetical protein
MTTFNTQVAAANAVLDGHLYWTSMFAYLESRTRPGVMYTNFAGDSASGILTLDAVGRSYRDVAEQIVAFREDPLIREVTARSASASIDATGSLTGVAFSVVLKIAPEAWERSSGSAAPPSAESGNTIRILTPGEELATPPSATTPGARSVTDPGAENGATAPGPFLQPGEGQETAS